jgi:cytochrome c oxidase subunit 2
LVPATPKSVPPSAPGPVKVNGFVPVMPTFQGLVTEEQLLQLIAYVKSLSTQGTAPSTGGASASTPQSAQPEIKR